MANRKKRKDRCSLKTNQQEQAKILEEELEEKNDVMYIGKRGKVCFEVPLDEYEIHMDLMEYFENDMLFWGKADDGSELFLFHEEDDYEDFLRTGALEGQKMIDKNTFESGNTGKMAIGKASKKTKKSRFLSNSEKMLEDEESSKIYMGVDNVIHFRATLEDPWDFEAVYSYAKKVEATIFNDIDFNVYILFKTEKHMLKAIGNTKIKTIEATLFDVDGI